MHGCGSDHTKSDRDKYPLMSLIEDWNMATNKLICQTEIDSSASETNLDSPKGIGGNINEKYRVSRKQWLLKSTKWC